MITASVDMTGFNKGLIRFIAVLGVEAPRVIKYECGKLIETLVRVTPPADVNKSKARIKSSIYARFEAAKQHVDDGDKKWSSNKNGRGDIVWYAWSPSFIFGVTKESDRRNDTVDELKRLLYTLTKGGRSALGFLQPRKQQRVLIKRKILTSQVTVLELTKLIQSHVGRLKAGWIVAIDALGFSGSLPEYVMKHKQIALGSFKDGTGSKTYPSFTITNSAYGVGQKDMTWLVKKAVGIRSKAMLANFRLLFSGKKKLSDYA